MRGGTGVIKGLAECLEEEFENACEFFFLSLDDCCECEECDYEPKAEEN